MLKKLIYLLLFVVVAGAIVFYFGPREAVTAPVTFDASSLPDTVSQLDDYLAKTEAAHSGITQGAEKQIVWADPSSKTQTDLAIVYLHGFSATLEETRPLPDMIAQAFGANLFYTRYSGHGQDGETLSKARLDDWVNDTAEAIEIGRRIGKRVVIIGTSTGATFSTWAATQPDLMKNVVGHVLISANYGVRAIDHRILTMPWARHILPLVGGAQRSFKASNAEHGKWWTSSYPTVSVIPMGASIAMALNAKITDIKVPALFIFSPRDRVVRVRKIRDVAAVWGANAKPDAANPIVDIYEVNQQDDPYRHVIAGRILSPSSTKPLADAAIAWIEKQL